TKSEVLSKSLDQSVSFHFAPGPIPLSVKLGAQGTAGVRYFVGVRPLAAEAQFIPFAAIKAYAQCGVDIGVASAGVRGTLQLVKFELRIGGKLEVKADPSSKGLALEEHAYVSSDIEMLKGEISLHAEIGFSFLKKKFDYTFWKFAGFKKSG